mgnify:CR=1 FL=1
MQNSKKWKLKHKLKLSFKKFYQLLTTKVITMTITSLRLLTILLLSFFALTEQLFPVLRDAHAGHLPEEPSRTGGRRSFVEAVPVISAATADSMPIPVGQNKENSHLFRSPFLRRVRRSGERRSARYSRGCCQGVWWPGTSYGWGYNSKVIVVLISKP